MNRKAWEEILRIAPPELIEELFLQADVEKLMESMGMKDAD